MGPKKGRDPTADENYWRTSIEDATLDEDNWKVKVIIIEAAGSDQDRIYINKFETVAADEKRFVIKNICKTETTFMINQLGSEKKIKDDNLRVFEEGQYFLKDKKEIPPDILALIIKHLILKMKEEYLFIKRQRLEVREGMRHESATMIDRVEVRGTVSVKPPEPLDLPSPIKGKGKKEDQEPISQTFDPTDGKKYNTSLRVRGEEWRDKVYVDDFPTEGPNLYVAITGFVEPDLPACLINIGIPLTAVVQVRIDCTATKVPSSLIRTSKRGQSQTEILGEKSMKFWEDIQNLRIQRETADIFKDTAFIVFTPPYWESDNLSGNSEKIYDELCFLMYDVQDLNRQHVHYLENMDIIQIPLAKSDDRKFKFYLEDIQDFPLECITVYSILNSILLSVEKSQALEQNSSITSLSTPLMCTKAKSKSVDEETKISRAEKLVKNVFSTLCKTDANKKSFRITYGEEYEQHEDPIVINYGDTAKYSTFHLGNINLDNIVSTTLLGMPLNSLWKSFNKAHGELEAKINFHVNLLLSCFDRKDIETAELNRLIHILACRKLYNNRSSLKTKDVTSSTINDFKKVYLKRSILAEPLPQCPSLLKISNSMSPSYLSLTKSEKMSNVSHEDDPEDFRIKFLFDCPDLSELVSAAEIANEQPINHMFDDFQYFEDFTSISAFQILLEAFNMFNCIDYKYCEVTDSIVLMFFNSHDKDGVSHQEWRCHIPTPISLQDFFDFVLEENFDWIQNGEKIYEENVIIRSQSACKEGVNPFPEKSCIETTEVELDLLMEGSLKYQEIAKMEEVSPETSNTNFTSKKTTLSPISIEVDSKSGKKTKSTGSTPKHLRQSFMAPGASSDTSVQIIKKPFIGYDLGNRRVEVFGQNSTFFSKDGTRVISKYTLTIPRNLEFIILNVVPGNTANEFWLHRALGDYVPAEIMDMCESFRITSKHHVVIYIKKLNYAFPLPQITLSDNISRTAPTVNNDENTSLFENHCLHSLLVTWPNGLITESVHIENSSDVSHIKQYYISPILNLDEEMRFVSLKGEVIIFRPSGIIEVLQPDGSIIRITKYEKKLIQSEPQETYSETSSEKSKKVKGKDKAPDKNKVRSKTPSKSSKNTDVDDSFEVSPEYALVIEDFETIESNGLRQRWINEIPHPIENLLIRTATDYCLREVFSRRMDGTNILLNKDGVHVVTFPNNTRIITNYFVEDELIYPEWTEEEKNLFFLFDSDEIETSTVKSKGSVSQKSYVESRNYSASVASSKFEEEQVKEKERTDGYVSVQIMYTIEHANFSTITINKSNGEIAVDSPNGTKVVVDIHNHYNICLDNLTNAKFDGKTLDIDYRSCSECSSTTSSSIRVRTDDKSSVTKMHQNWLKMKDSFGKNIVVNEEGHISIMDEPNSKEICLNDVSENVEDKKNDNKSDTSILSHVKCREMFLAKAMRFFVLNRDLTCSELVHRAILNEYKQNCRWQPWCLINHYDTFGDHRSLLSILTPVHLTETEKWLMDSKLADKPKHLTYKDLKKDSGKGFYHWMRPYDRYQPKPMKPPNVLPERLPRAFIIRTLEQQWKDDERQTLKGAKELLVAILRYRRAMESDSELILHVPLRDTRSDAEKRTDDIIQALGQRIYDDLKTRLNQDVQKRAKAAITTKPEATPEMSLESELVEEEFGEQRRLEEERESQLIEAEAAEISPNLKRYWRRRAEECKEEKFYKYLLREGSVPPYFRNVLGGAIWWDIYNAAEDAANVSERNKMKCACADEGTTHTDDSITPFM
ncbi:unnamed protein product [Chilo suppressalis]|uniref:Sperm-associated antigen 17 n=1 Tax=Chilo suppressalis TaxID=168631 RepID=A0ABN8B4F1_CHISP|nr:unnamed protein product [Chilo suppressalis]